MTLPKTPDDVRVEQGPEKIWLSPICDLKAHHGDGRTWASPAPESVCEDCGAPWVEYVRSDRLSSTRPSDESGGWQPIETAPHACCVLAARFDHDAGEWVYSIVLSPPGKPFTHWRMLPTPPALSTSNSSVIVAKGGTAADACARRG